MTTLSAKELREKKYFDAVAQKYDRTYGYNRPFTKYKIQKKTDEFINSIRPFLSQDTGLKILEIGCGTGEYTQTVASGLTQSDIVGLDISENVIKIAKRKCKKLKNVRFVVQSIYKTDFKANQFDIVYGFYSLHHMDVRKVFKEVYRILKPGGYVYFCEPNLLNPIVYAVKSSAYLKKIVGDSPEEWAINPLTVTKMATGFKVIKLSLSEYVLPVGFLNLENLKTLDKFLSILRFIPFFKYLGGSTQILMKKDGTLSLKEKYEIEKNFHDNWARKIRPEQVNSRGAFEAATAVENKFALAQMNGLRGGKILDLGCGMGDASLYFASRGAKVSSIDISPQMIGLVKKLAKEQGYLKNINAKVMVAENLEFPSSYFDYVFGNGILHHVERDAALKEVYRVLRPGGIATFIEPLAHNPIINIYRKVAEKVRTPTEEPIKYSQLDKLTQARFKKAFHKEFHLMTLLIFIWFFVVERVDPNKQRYWKKIIDDADQIKGTFLLLKRIDELILRSFPGMRKYCWNTVLVYKK